MNTVKCKYCGTQQEVSREGWLVDSVVRDERHNIVLVNGKIKREVKYFGWTHVVGHWRGRKSCPGSGTNPADHRRKIEAAASVQLVAA